MKQTSRLGLVFLNARTITGEISTMLVLLRSYCETKTCFLGCSITSPDGEGGFDIES